MKQKERQKLEIKNLEEFAKHVNSMFATDSGTLFAKYWLREMGLFTHEPKLDGAALVEDRGAKRFYLQYVRPYLTPEIKQQIEGQL